MLKSNPHPKLSVVLATRNEEANIRRCLDTVTGLADEIIVFDEYSTDKTTKIAESLGAKVFLEPHHDNFHITKQKALDQASGEWILQLDADEALTPKLSREIRKVLEGENVEIDKDKIKLFERHKKNIDKRDGKSGSDEGEIAGYFIPRRNMFLGKPLIHGGVYPDGVIRLVKKGFASYPLHSVHEQIDIKGKVGWLNGDLLHFDSPTLNRYLFRLNRYTDLQAQKLHSDQTGKGLTGFCRFVFLLPLYTFVNIYFRHMGLKDGVNGFLWSFFSSLHFPIAYFKYVINNLHK